METFKGKIAPWREEWIGNTQSVLSNIKQRAALDRWARNLEHICPWEISQKYGMAIYFKSITTAWTNWGCSQLWPSHGSSLAKAVFLPLWCSHFTPWKRAKCSAWNFIFKFLWPERRAQGHVSGKWKDPGVRPAFFHSVMHLTLS